MASATSEPPRGTFVVSLDFELHWGVRDKFTADGPYRQNLLGARAAVPRILSLFRQFDIAATWATVGFLFARNRDELVDFFPTERPAYTQAQFDPYREAIGRNESEDPLHFGRSLLEMIRETERQEIGSHTFSHYYCLEEGQSATAFRADLASAQRIAADSLGLKLRSLVLPRNQFNPRYATVIREAGFICYRGNQRGAFYTAADEETATSSLRRAARFIDAYIPLSPHGLSSSRDPSADGSLRDVRASRFLRSWNPRLAKLEPLRALRIINGMRAAARSGQAYHLWWHPHNFGAHIDESIQFLSGILKEFQILRDRFGFQSMSMAESAAVKTVVTSTP